MPRTPQPWRRSKKLRREPRRDRRARRGGQADRDLVPDAMRADTARAECSDWQASANQIGGAVNMPFENILQVPIELSFSSWLVATRLPGAEKSRLHRVEGGNTVALLALIAELRSRASAK